MKKIILNHKSYLSYDEIIEYKKDFKKIKSDKYEFVLFPSTLYLTSFIDYNTNIGTQNFYSVKPGSFTGELNLESLKKIGVAYTMIAPHDRRKFLSESSYDSKEKLFKSLTYKMNTLLYVGEVRKTNNAFIYVKREINMYLNSIEKENLKYLSIVYEPNWAIGNSEIQDKNKISKMVKRIKIYLKNKYNINVNVYYAGIITENNIKDIMNVTDGIVLNRVSTNISELKNLLSFLE